MAAMDLFSKANEEFVGENYENAAELYTKAIEEDSTQSDFYANRAHAFLKLDKNEDAVDDTTKALELNPGHVKAHLRKGHALFNLEKYSEAKEIFEQGKSKSDGDKTFDTWLRKCEAELNMGPSSNNNPSIQVGSSTIESKQDEEPTMTPMPTAPRIRHDWYETEKMVVINILLKNVKKEDLLLDVQEDELNVCVKLATGSDYNLHLDLAHPIIVSRYQSRILSMKIEIKLPKIEGIQWTKLERDPSAVAAVKQFKPESSSSDKSAHAYPSSSHNTRNWDQIAADITADEKNDKDEGDAALNKLFQQIYSDGSEETRKAMNKSFVESGGTVLSTNWGEIKEKSVDVKPPDGMEFKKWQQ